VVTDHTDVLVVGGRCAGSAAAITLARRRREDTITAQLVIGAVGRRPAADAPAGLRSLAMQRRN